MKALIFPYSSCPFIYGIHIYILDLSSLFSSAPLSSPICFQTDIRTREPHYLQQVLVPQIFLIVSFSFEFLQRFLNSQNKLGFESLCVWDLIGEQMDQIDYREDQISVTVDDDEILHSGSEIDEVNSIGSDRIEGFAWKGMVGVGEESMEHELVKRSFLYGMGLVSKDTKIVAVHRINVNSGLTRQAKAKSFRIFSQAVAEKCGGDANIKHAWYGASREEICGIVSHGFSLCGRSGKRDSHGVGVQLFPAKFSTDG